MKERVAAVIPAAGAGVRMGGKRPKQFLELGGMPVVARTLGVFQSCPAVDFIVLVVPGPEVDACAGLVEAYGLGKVRKVVPGGARRQDSVRLGLEACAGDCEFVLIHDGVRPLLTADLVERCVRGAFEHGAVIAALPAKETVKEADSEGVVVRTPDRRSLWLVQTPQAFKTREILGAHRRALEEGWDEMTDDALLLERIGVRVRVIPGEEDNIKVTTPNDLEIARHLLEMRKAE